MSLLSLVLMTEAVAGPGAFERALDDTDDLMRELDRMERLGDDRATGADGAGVYLNDLPATVAQHTKRAPRSAFCLGRVCRRTP